MPYQTEMAQAKREGLKSSDFVFPKKKKWPIQDLDQAKVALTWSTWPQHKKVADVVRKAVFMKYPELKKSNKSEAKERLESVLSLLSEVEAAPEKEDAPEGYKDYMKHIKALRDWVDALATDHDLSEKHKGQLLGTIGECEAKMKGIMASIKKD